MKKVISIISICLIFVSLFTFPALADNVNRPNIFITTTNAVPGDTLEVKVYLKNNPGIVSAKLDFNFDENLTLVEATNGEAFSALTYIPPKQLSNGAYIKSSCQFAWQGFDIENEDINDGIIITLVFNVSENAQTGDSLNISVSTTQGNVVDNNLNPIMLSAEKNIHILDYLPGDVNDDGVINMLDTVSISRYIVDNGVTDPDGYNITLNERAANVNDDGAINMLDVVLLCRYIVDGCETIPEPNGYNIELLPQTELCLHRLTKTDAVSATCIANGNIAYWHCSKCHGYFSDAAATTEIVFSETIVDATGHTEVIDAAVAPTHSSTGLTEGKHCSTCNAVLVAQQVIDALVTVHHSVSYENTKTADISSYPTRFAEHEGLDLSTLTPTATGYTFDGWYVGNNRLTTIAVGTTSDIVLTARWTPVTVTVTLNETDSLDTDRTVSFNLNGASGTAPATQTVTTTTGLTYPAIPTRDGYVFAGWYATPECTGSPYDFSADITEDITLYAKWLSYSGSGYVDYNSSKYVYAYSKSSSTDYYAFVPLTSGTITIYTNDTWDTYGCLYNSSKTSLISDDDAGEGYNFSISYNVTAGTLYYIKVCGYNSSGYTTVYISGDDIADGGKVALNCETERVSYGENFTLTVPQKEGYTFDGWFDGVGGTGTRYTAADGESVKVWDKTQNTTLHAKWNIKTYTLTLNNQGGTGAANVTTTYGEAMPSLTAPTKTGYTFAGYYDAATGGVKYYNADMSSAKDWDIDENCTLYARWTANTYTITLNNQGGTGASSATVTYGLSLPTLTAPIKVGYRFLGYYDAPTGGTQYYSSTMASQLTWTGTSNKTLYARWEAKQYTVTFNTNQGTGAQSAVTVTYGSNMSPITVTPTRPGYTFTGYYDAISGGTKYYNADLSSAKTWDKEANTVLYAHWHAFSYTVKFNANGGTGTMPNQEFEYGESKNLNANTFTRTGYTFAGWNTAANGTGTNYANGASVLNLASVANATVQLYAKWTANTYEISLQGIDEVKKDITVTFNKNYSGATSSTVTLDNNDLLAYPTNPTRSGYIFTGWYTTPACTTKYNFSGNITNDMTLYAGWTSSGYTTSNSSSYPWSVSGNSLSSTNKAHSSSSEYRITASTPLVVSFSYKTSSESGYDYLYIKRNGTTLKSCSGSTSYVSYSVSLNTGEYLSFIYSKDGSVSNNSDTAYISELTFASNANYTSTATAVCGETDGYIYDENASYTINCNYGDSFKLPVPPRVGYTFGGWYDGIGGTGTRYTDSQGESLRAWNRTQDTTLYAKWVKGTYTLTLNNQGGTGTTSVTATFGEAMPGLTAPTKTGYTFAGYYDAATGGEKYYNADMSSAKVWDIDENRTLYARWTANTYTLTLNNQGGTGINSATATYGLTLPTLTAPTKPGHRFLGYYDAPTGGTQYYSSTMASQLTWTGTSNKTLYARWQANQYTVSFNTNQGTGAQTAVTVTYGANMSPITVAPTKSGYIFDGYYDAVSGGTKYYNADLSSARTWDKESNAVLYAHWRGFSYTIRFNANGGTGTMADQELEYGTSEYLNANAFTRTGYTFAGWNTAANGTGTNYANSVSVLNLTNVANSTIQLYAKWTVNNYRITLDDIEEVKKDITVTFNKNYSGSTSSTVTLENGDVLSYPAKPTRSGYIFTGWYTTSACTTKYNFSGNITDDMTLYAGWTTSGRTITNNSTYPWSVSGSSLTSTNKSHSSSSEYRITASIPLVVSFSYKVSSETNYDYLYIKKNGTTLKSCSGSTSYVSYSVTLNTGDYLSFIYSKDGSVSNNSDTAYISGLTFASNVNYTSTATAVCNDIDGCIYSDGSTQSINCNYGDSFTLPVPTRAGYTFDGWYDGIGGTGTKYANASGESVRTWNKAQDTTLYARWIPATYTITYNLNGGTNHTDNPATYTPASNSITLKKPSKSGYSFIGWTTTTNSTPNMNYTINSGSTGNITLTANWVEYDVLDIEYDESINYIGINTPLTADYFDATCKDTDNNEVNITVTYSGSLVSGQYVDVTLTAQSRGKVSTTTIEDVKVYGTPSITVNKTTINTTDSITASTFGASAYDSFNGPLNVSIELVEGSATGSGNRVYTFSATDKCGNRISARRSVRVYSANDISFDLTPATAIKATSTGEEFDVSATDTFGNACTVQFVVRSGYTLTAGNTISVCFEATDANGNKKTSEVISNVKVYGEPTIVCKLPKITTQTNVGDIFDIIDSFGVKLNVTAQFVATRVPGTDVGVRLVAQDAAGNTINKVENVSVICINHAISANCTCEICDEIVHTPGENCTCIICGAVSHDLNDSCYCEGCNNYYHNFIGGECTVCDANENDIWDGTVATSFARGTGTSTNPYIIETGAQLAYLARSVNNGTNYSGKYFQLGNDINLNSLSWTPIGTGSLSDGDDYTYLAFSGNFNGNGHRITNCKINTTAHKRAGLFGGLNGATVQNLAIRNANIQVTQQHVVCGGVLTGTINNTTIANCDVSGTVYVVDTSTDSNLCANAGMIAGRSSGTSSIQNCSASGDVTGRMTNSWNAYVGGLVGSDSSSSTRLTITNCYFTGNVTANGYENGYASGLVGISNTGTTISKCFAVANITSNTYSNAIAYPWSGSSATISSTYYSSNKTSSYGTSTSVTNLKTQTWLSTNLGWDFTNTWTVPSGEYPKLKAFID